MSADNVFMQLRVLAHRLVSSNRKKTQSSLLKRATTLAEENGQARFWKDSIVRKLTEQIGILNGLFFRQCNGVAAQRLRRTTQIMLLYKKVYGESVVRIINRFSDPFMRNDKIKTKFFLYGAALFSWQNNQLTDSDLDSCIEDMRLIEDMMEADHGQTNTAGNSNDDNNNPSRDTGTAGNHGNQRTIRYMDTWSCVLDKKNFKLWSKPVQGTDMCEYKVYGTFTDITPKSFYTVQVDLAYRKQWDKRVIKLDVVDKDQESGTEVVHWVTRFVWPLMNRDYVFVRRFKIDHEKNVMVLMSHSTVHPSIPEDTNCIRITKYESDMVIKPHTSFNENGLDYVLTYYDDPQATIPTMAYDWLASKGVPDFLESVHKAARNLQTTNGNQNNVNDESGCGYGPSIPQCC